MTNEEKMKRIKELEKTIANAELEIDRLKNSLVYQDDYTDRCYHNKHRSNLFLEVLDGKDTDACLVLKYEVNENLYDGTIVPKNNEFNIEVSLSWISKHLIDNNYVQVSKGELEENRQKIIYYVAEHFFEI